MAVKYEVKERTFNMEPVRTSKGKELIITTRIPHDYNLRQSIYTFGKYKLIMYENCIQVFLKNETFWIPLSEVLQIEEYKKKRVNCFNPH